jgi:hypothetical protein
MSTDHEANKAAIRRFHDATNTGDLELISNTIAARHCRLKRPGRKH